MDPTTRFVPIPSVRPGGTLSIIDVGQSIRNLVVGFVVVRTFGTNPISHPFHGCLVLVPFFPLQL